MSMWLFNPPEPNCSPTTKIEEEQLPLQFNFCGNCPAVARYQKVIAPPIDSNPLAAPFAGDFILKRSEDAFLHDTDVNLPYPCTWLGAGGDTGDPASPAVIEFGRFAVEGFDLGSQWYVIFVIKGLAFPAVYSLFSFPGPAGAGNDPRPFRCLNPNTFWLADSGDLVGLGGSQILPSSIIVQPFWP